MNIIKVVLLLSIASAGASAITGVTAGPKAAPEWDKEQAAKYLDDRMDLWFDKGRKLKTGPGQASCIACHTVVPYALARPALRRALGASAPTPQETRLLEGTLRRVRTFSDHELTSPDKAAASRGTEAVLDLLILAGEDARAHRPQPSEATRQAFQEFWERQRPDGAWDWLDFADEPEESAGAVYYGAALAAIAVGTAPGASDYGDAGVSGRIDKLRAYLNGNYASQHLYNQAWMLLASTHLPGLLGPKETAELVKALLNRQNPDGGWSLFALGPWSWSGHGVPPLERAKLDLALLSRSDGYGTGLAAYALRRAGLRSGAKAVARAREWLVENQRECTIGSNHWKCWRAYSLNKERENGEPWTRMFMSDSATAFAVLALLPGE